MFYLLSFIIGTIFNLFKSKKELLIQNCLQKKEIEILLRQNQKKRLKLNHSDRIIFSVLYKIGNIKAVVSIVKPETVLRWQKELIKRFWTYKAKNRVGRPPVQHEIRQLILSMKNDNLFWGYKKIRGELLKLGIALDQKSIRNILTDFRRRGKVRRSLTWNQFLKVQIHSLYAMDFFTIDTVLNQRYYVFFLMYHKTREIVQFAITRNPTREFVRQQLIEFEQRLDHVVGLIHDNAAQFNLNYPAHGIRGITISVSAPNMNALAERFVGSVRRESLDYYLLIREKQIMNILKKYIDYYNSKRPHQGLEQRIPMGYKPQVYGRVFKLPILGGLCHHYMRSAA
jgi:transposase InsO family protein